MLCRFPVDDRAYPVAQSAISTLVLVDNRIQETLLVALHCDAVSWATLCTSAASATVLLVNDSDHLFACVSDRVWVVLSLELFECYACQIVVMFAVNALLADESVLFGIH